MGDIEYKDNEKVLYRTRCKLNPEKKESEEVDCFVTENSVMIDAEKPIQIPLSHIKSCTDSSKPPYVAYTLSSSHPQVLIPGEVKLDYTDELKKFCILDLEMPLANVNRFKRVVDMQIVGKLTNFIEVEEHYSGRTQKRPFAGVRDFFRDKTRDNFCADLQSLGIDARMVLRDRPEEEIGEIRDGRSLGIVHISEGPIRWVNVRKVKETQGNSTRTYYYTDYGIPDPRLGLDFPRVRIETVLVKKFPVFGKVIDVRWKGQDFGLGIISRLESDYRLKYPLILDVSITALSDYGCWIISAQYAKHHLSEKMWSGYQSVVENLLADFTTVG
jgi:hypothetical protein